MKPLPPLIESRPSARWDRTSQPPRFPAVDCHFHAGLGAWRPFSDGDDRDRRRFRNLNREFLAESAREQSREMFVLGLVVLTAAWPVLYMVFTVVSLLCRAHP